MTAKARLILFAVAAIGLAAFLAWGFAGLPRFGDYRGIYGAALNASSVPQRHITDVVSAVNFDYRGVDTMGEEFIFFAAVLAVVLVLRAQRREMEEGVPQESEPYRQAEVSEAVRILGMGLVAPTVVFGIYVVAHGHLTPGGGFQGGVVLATALLLALLAGEYAAIRRLQPLPLVELAEAAGAAGYIVIGTAGLIFGAAFLDNVLPLGTVGQLPSAGVVPLIDVSVGLEVAGGFVVLISEFFEQALLVRSITSNRDRRMLPSPPTPPAPR